MERQRRILGIVFGTALCLVFGSSLAGLGLLAAPRQQYPQPHRCDPVTAPCERAANEFIRADVGPNGAWALGTTGGDPATTYDDDKVLLYGFAPAGKSEVATSFNTVRVSGPRGQFDLLLQAPARQISDTGRVVSYWSFDAPYRIGVTQTTRLDQNPFSGRPDVVDLGYDLSNATTGTLDIGIRSVLDVKLGNNDGAPYFIPGVGTITEEREYTGTEVPAFWLAFESPRYEPNRLRSVGILRGPGLVPPDRVAIAYWIDLQKSPWQYQVNATKPVTSDSAVALYWDPHPIQAGQSYAVHTKYGIPGNLGGSAFLSAPVEGECGSSFTAAVFVNNFELTPLTGGQATLELPPGVALAPAETATKTLATIGPGSTGSAVWQLRILPGTRGMLKLKTTAAFDGNKVFVSESPLDVTCPFTPPTATPAPPTPTPRPTATRTPAPTATTGPIPPTPDGRVCRFIDGRVPPAAINAALANPGAVLGWGQPNNPGLPPGPFNPPRRWLSIVNISAPYHPQFNPLVFKSACP